MKPINDILLCELLVEVKNYLSITWEDEAMHSKLLGIIERGIRYLNQCCGVSLDYSVQDKPKELLLDYCRYAQSNALEEFQHNYLSEILTLQFNFSNLTGCPGGNSPASKQSEGGRFP